MIVNMTVDQPLLIPWSWCTSTGLLKENLTHIQVKMLFDVIEVPDRLYLQYTTDKNFVECKYWVIKLPWIIDNIYFRIKYTINEEISDGYSTYPPGVYTITFIGKVKYDKQLISEIYGFGFTLPSDSNYDTVSYYRPDGTNKIFEVLYHKQVNNDAIELQISSFAEDTDIGCKSKIYEQLKLFDTKVEINTEYVTINDLYFTKVYTPKLFWRKGKRKTNY